MQVQSNATSKCLTEPKCEYAFNHYHRKTFLGGAVHKTATSWLVYHPKREYRSFDGQPVHFDNTEGNQDPYI